MSLAENSNKTSSLPSISQLQTSSAEKINNNSAATVTVDKTNLSLEHTNMTIDDVYNLAREFLRGSEFKSFSDKINGFSLFSIYFKKLKKGLKQFN